MFAIQSPDGNKPMVFAGKRKLLTLKQITLLIEWNTVNNTVPLVADVYSLPGHVEVCYKETPTYSASQEVGGTLIGEDGHVVMAGAVSVGRYQQHQTHGFHGFPCV
jgi:hypothetical protein